MISHSRIRSASHPSPIQITEYSVFVSLNVTPYSEIVEGHEVHGFEYDCLEYDKDEYILKLGQDLIDTQAALCDIYELVNGGE